MKPHGTLRIAAPLLTLALATTSCTGGGGALSSLPPSAGAPPAPADVARTATAPAPAGTAPSSDSSASQASASQRTTPAHRERWFAAWGAPINTQASSGSAAPSNATVRDVARVSLGGSAVRIRVSNALSTTTPLVIGGATIALQQSAPSAQVVPGTAKRITFGGKPGITLAPGTQYAYSDPVPFAVHAQQNVAVSLYLPAATEPSAPTAVWNSNYATANGAGDQTQDAGGAPYTTNLSGATFTPGVPDGAGTGYGLTAIDVLTGEADGAVVMLGSSTFQGNNATQDGYDRVTDLLSARVDAEIPSGARKGIVNAGIGGDALYLGLNRMARDVFSQSGVTGVMIYDINDIGIGGRTLDQIEADYRTAVNESHARHIRVFCSTWAPESLDLRGEPSAEREAVNAWLLNSGTCDQVVDWDAVLRDPNVPQAYNPAYFSDSIHANAAGHRQMANAVNVPRWFGY
jgi:lysophospholipase L1-like esterase